MRNILMTCAVTWLAACGVGEVTLDEGGDEGATLGQRITGGQSVPPGERPGTGFVSYLPWTQGRSCSAVRIGANVAITAGHCVTDLDPTRYRFGWGAHTRKPDGTRPVTRLKKMNGGDLAMLELGGCGSARTASVIGMVGPLGPHYLLDTYLHEVDRDGARRQQDPMNLILTSGTALRTRHACSEAAVWGGDSGSPLYLRDTDGLRPVVVGLALTVNGFCGSLSQQEVGYIALGAPQVRSFIEQTLQEWSDAARPCAAEAATDDAADGAR